MNDLRDRLDDLFNRIPPGASVGDIKAQVMFVLEVWERNSELERKCLVNVLKDDLDCDLPPFLT